ALEKIQPHIVSFEDTVTIIRENYAELLEKEECWSKAAQVLAGIDLDSGMRNIDPAYKLQKNIKIAMLYLEDDDPVNAELYIKKASSLINNSKVWAAADAAAELQYKVCYARILDSKRRFLEAALR
ncbi:PCI domain-containing protein, partial [Haematococcus lacustris]